ncbi:hypothetical protein ACFXAZ_33195 [Streptomyces sp. NPDC059477]|uniref:hypothetical protein n=1 Tax=Streptomyces sp. NPDC059477 TaxID=3346847 RepID=UPI00368DF24B
MAQMGEAAWKEALCEPGHRIALDLWVSEPAAERVSGGYRLRQLPGRFSSGIDHARWILAGLDIESTEPGWAAEPHVVLIPVEDVTVLDGWHTFGLRGASRRSFVIEEAYVPERQVLSQSELDPLTAVRPRPAGAVFRMAFTAIGTVALSGVPLGTARPPSICTPGPAGIARRGHTRANRDRRRAEALLLAYLALLARSSLPAAPVRSGPGSAGTSPEWAGVAGMSSTPFSGRSVRARCAPVHPCNACGAPPTLLRCIRRRSI